MKLISITSACYNEEENVEEVYRQVKAVFARLKDYQYEHIFIDNGSTDRTVPLLKAIAKQDRNVKIIVNSRNFGPIRSPFYGLLQARGDAAMMLAADLQEPPEMIAEFLKKWEEGYKIVIGIKKKSREFPLMFAVRKIFYGLIARLSEVRQIPNFTGFGLYDKKVLDILREFRDPYPYFRGLISDIGFVTAEVEYVQNARTKGVSKFNFFVLYDVAMLGITNYSKVPLRLATMLGFSISIASLLVAVGYLFYKLIFWNSFNFGIAPLVIGSFFFASVQLFFIGILGEYIGAIHTQVLKRPLVIEKERINF
jgi:polyisoprenyl-phosphate glycosyltransferase